MIFTGKHLCWGLFFIKTAGLQTSNCIKKGLQHRYFLTNIEKFIRILILKNQKQPPEEFCKKRCSSKFQKFHRKHLCLGLFLNKVATLACNFINKETLAQVFSYEFCTISIKNTFFTEHLWATASEEHLQMAVSTFWETVL